MTRTLTLFALLAIAAGAAPHRLPAASPGEALAARPRGGAGVRTAARSARVQRSAVASVAVEPAAIERTAFLMGTLLRVRAFTREDGAAADGVAPAGAGPGAAAPRVPAPDERDAVETAIGAVFDEVARLEEVLSTWSPAAELARANAAPVGVRHVLSPELHGLLMEARAWVERTDHAFDPAVGALIDAWDLRGEGRTPAPAVLAAARAASGWSAGVLTADAPVLQRPDAAWWIDSGGFGKGAALRSAAAVLRARGVSGFTLDFGGQLVQHEVRGDAARIAVAHPRERTRAVAVLDVRNGSVATSGASERFVEVAGERLGHIVDARTGRVAPAWGSVTVVAADAFEADVLSTALFVMGAEAALAWGARHPEYGVLALSVRADGSVCARWNAGMHAWLVDARGLDRGPCDVEESR